MEQDYPNLLIESEEQIDFYLYSGRIPLPHSLALHLFPKANHLQIDQLKQLCENVIFLVVLNAFKSFARSFAKDWPWKMLLNV